MNTLERAAKTVAMPKFDLVALATLRLFFSPSLFSFRLFSNWTIRRKKNEAIFHSIGSPLSISSFFFFSFSQLFIPFSFFRYTQ
jgi:hypothetical protein